MGRRSRFFFVLSFFRVFVIPMKRDVKIPERLRDLGAKREQLAAASYMPLDEARRIIRLCAADFLRSSS